MPKPLKGCIFILKSRRLFLTAGFCQLHPAKEMAAGAIVKKTGIPFPVMQQPLSLPEARLIIRGKEREDIIIRFQYPVIEPGLETTKTGNLLETPDFPGDTTSQFPHGLNPPVGKSVPGGNGFLKQKQDIMEDQILNPRFFRKKGIE